VGLTIGKTAIITVSLF